MSASLRVELSNSFNKGLFATIEDNEGGQSGGDDDSGGEDDDSDNSDDDNDDDDNDGKPVTLADKILVKAKECLAHLSQTELFQYSNRNCKPGMSALKQQHQMLPLGWCVSHVVGSATPNGL
ncbi:hypothetical protein OS493_014614 [Desmophyllum pertusum]|uniref:Uncharacterized protein n=1 Tax=Desmophyllum pertusum TaxID=174260 RepID=A0A9W9YRB5_9CNID|nr:hypothetical protein OS493_014614 [Desmophyllum pertusum]